MNILLLEYEMLEKFTLLLIFLMREIHLWLAYRILFETILGGTSKVAGGICLIFLLHHFNSTQLVEFFMHAFEICTLFCKMSFLEFNGRDAYYYIFKKIYKDFPQQL